MKMAEVVVVGAGPAGVAAALAAAGAGRQVLLIDEQATVGGHLRWSVGPVAGLPAGLGEMPGVHAAAELAIALDRAGVEVLTDAIVWGWFDGNVLGVATAAESYTLGADALVVATGSTDRVAPFPGWSLPGVMTASAAQIFLNIHRVFPGRRFVVIGDGPEAEAVVEAITLAGAVVVARAATEAGVQALGNDEVEQVVIDGTEHAADAVVIALGRQPDPALALQAQVALGYAEAAGGQVPLRDEHLQTSVPGLYVVGDAAGLVTVAEASVEGQLAGLAAAGADGAQLAAASDALDQVRSAERRAVVAGLRLPIAAGA